MLIPVIGRALEAGTVTTNDWVDWSLSTVTDNWRQVLDQELELMENQKLSMVDKIPDLALRLKY